MSLRWTGRKFADLTLYLSRLARWPICSLRSLSVVLHVSHTAWLLKVIASRHHACDRSCSVTGELSMCKYKAGLDAERKN
jgi:hypothetical protein